MARDDAPVLELTGVTKRFRAVEALVDADLVVHRREVVALVGDNAAGKSTLARIVSGVYVPDEGTIRIGGQDMVMADPCSKSLRWPRTSTSRRTSSSGMK